VSRRSAETQSVVDSDPPAPLLPSLGRRPDPILPGDSFAIAGSKAMWVQVDRMLAREEAVRDPSQTDALKRYRVATRRLRAALRTFRDAYPKRATKQIRTGLSDLADALGAVRDLDVRLEELDRWAGGQDDAARTGVVPLREALASRRRSAAAGLARTLDARRHHRLMAGLVSFVTAPEHDSTTNGGPPDRSIRDRAGSSVWTAYELVRAFVSLVPSADLPALHRLRIEAKRLRYTLEFLGDVLGPDAKWAIERLVTLQDHLGALNDTTLAVDAIRAFVAENDETLATEQRAAVAAYLGDRERELRRLRRSVEQSWRPIVSVTFARKLARAVVSQPITTGSAPPTGR
jgi:triphosphatase